MRRSSFLLRVLTQTTKHSPVDLRPALGIRPELSAATLAHLLAAYARNGFVDPDQARSRLRWCIDQLDRLRVRGYAEPCWGYHFDVQTRVFFYPSSVPNTIATAFAGLGLLDAYELTGDAAALRLAVGAGEFFARHVPQTPARQGAYFGYLPGDTTPIHNANMLVCALLARLAEATGRSELGEAAGRGIRYTVGNQREDGSWAYGERRNLRWVDGFHTGYVLDSLLTCIETGIGGDEAEEAWRRGLRFYVEMLISPAGEPKYTPSSLYPIDAQCAAQAIQSLARAAAREPELAERRWLVLEYTLRSLARADGSFAFQRHRFWVNPTPHPRWVEAPMLAALAHLIASAP